MPILSLTYIAVWLSSLLPTARHRRLPGTQSGPATEAQRAGHRDQGGGGNRTSNGTATMREGRRDGRGNEHQPHARKGGQNNRDVSVGAGNKTKPLAHPEGCPRDWPRACGVGPDRAFLRPSPGREPQPRRAAGQTEPVVGIGSVK